MWYKNKSLITFQKYKSLVRLVSTQTLKGKAEGAEETDSDKKQVC